MMGNKLASKKKSSNDDEKAGEVDLPVMLRRGAIPAEEFEKSIYIPEELEDHEIGTGYHTPCLSVLDTIELEHVPGPSGVQNSPSVAVSGTPSTIVFGPHVIFVPPDTGSVASSIENVGVPHDEEIFEESHSFRFSSKEYLPEADTVVKPEDFVKEVSSVPESCKLEQLSEPGNSGTQKQDTEGKKTQPKDIESGENVKSVEKELLMPDKPKPRVRRTVIVAGEDDFAEFKDVPLDASNVKNKSNKSQMLSKTRGKVEQLVRRFSVHVIKSPEDDMKDYKLEKEKGETNEEPVPSTSGMMYGVEKSNQGTLNRNDLSKLLQCKKDIEELLKNEKDLKDLLQNKRKLKELMVELERAYDFIGSTMNFVHNSVLMQQNLLTGMLEEIHLITERMAQYEVQCEEFYDPKEEKSKKRICMIQ